ncbi:hypothetical protein [Desulfonatronovibrio hydrogenovorans]|uniref:hypothetical protein n=1 Tax=Desulfonatronovibrio hydrogenovorans TaxID=53245 RepID=UPI00048A4C5B|nr:hypothetical protein [Desulfonatronovibrio hydrogenovorans]
MDKDKIAQTLTPEALEDLFPIERSNDFFEAFYGDQEDSHFDIRLGFEGIRDNRIFFSFRLIQRPGKCLACNMTYGLPHVLGRHPLINLSGLVDDIARLLGLNHGSINWSLGSTAEESRDLHKIPLIISTG